MYGFYGLRHHTVDTSGDVTDAGRTNKRQTREDRATQPMDSWKAEFRNYSSIWIIAINPQTNALLFCQDIFLPLSHKLSDDNLQNVTTAVILTLPQVREKMVLETILDIEFQDMVGGDKAIFYQVIKIKITPIVINAILHQLTFVISSDCLRLSTNIFETMA